MSRASSVDAEGASRVERRKAGWALLLLLPAPSVGAYMFLVGAPDGTIGHLSYAIAKAYLLLFPIIWYRWVEGGSWSLSPLASENKRSGVLFGVISGIVIATVIVGTHALLGESWVDTERLAAKAKERGFDTWGRYLQLATFLSLVNSLLEEYVWRWFVFVQFERLFGRLPSIFLAAAAFTIHHIIALGAQFDGEVVALGAAGVFVGSLIWSWSYGRYRSIWPGYLSHIGADVGVFVVGARLLFDAF